MKLKKFFVFFTALALIYTFSISVYAKTRVKEYSWFCIRSGTKQPTVTEEEKLINRYNGICLDRSVFDDGNEKVLYLTFDVGYENGNVEKMLDILKLNNIRAAFFILDNIILKNEDLVTRMAEEGHIICNHTRNHKNICRWTKDEIEADLLSLEQIYNDATGKIMSKYFRFPEGKYSVEALKYLSELGYKSVFWSFAYADWDNNNQMNPAAAISKVLCNTHNGSIMLFHPTSEVNVYIMPKLIEKWKEIGYTFSTLDELEF